MVFFSILMWFFFIFKKQKTLRAVLLITHKSYILATLLWSANIELQNEFLLFLKYCKKNEKYLFTGNKYLFTVILSIKRFLRSFFVSVAFVFRAIRFALEIRRVLTRLDNPNQNAFQNACDFSILKHRNYSTRYQIRFSQ